MHPERILQELLGLLEANGVLIRHEAMGGAGGGLCRVRDKMIYFFDSDSSVAEAAAVCARALGEAVDVDNVYMRPEVREFVEKIKGPEE